MPALPNIESLQAALIPVEALRGEQSQLESWVRESFAALDALHDDLAGWQRDVTRQQAELDQREAALADRAAIEESAAVAELRQQTQQLNDEIRRLEDENADQLQAVEDLDRQLAVALAELRLIHKHADESAAALHAEREQAYKERRSWTDEMRALRRLVERQSTLLEELTGLPKSHDAEAADLNSSALPDGELPDEPSGAGARSAELRRRANSRRAGRRPTT